jgi:hypothetical protein
MINKKFEIDYSNFNPEKEYTISNEKVSKSNARIIADANQSELLAKVKEKKSEKNCTKEKILEAHSNCKTWNDVLGYLGIWHGTYTRLCKKYNIVELKADRSITTKLSKQHNVEVWKLIEEEVGIYNNKNYASAQLGINGGSIQRLATNRGKKAKGKINSAVGVDGFLYTFEYTGVLIKNGKKDPSKQIRAYKLYEEFYKEYDSIKDADTDLNLSFAPQLKGICEQTGGYKIYKK